MIIITLIIVFVVFLFQYSMIKDVDEFIHKPLETEKEYEDLVTRVIRGD